MNGVTLSYVSPMNESDSPFAGGGQEGMAVPALQRAIVVQAVGRALAQQAPYCRIIADESSHVGDQFNPEVPQWMTIPGTSQYVAALAHHLYDFPGDLPIQLARQIGRLYGEALWCTEVCCINSSTGVFGQHLTVDQAVETSATQSLGSVAPPLLSPSRVVSGSVPAQSITTFLLGGRR